MQESMTIGACSHVGLVRQNNEDYHAVLQKDPDGPCALILADGMGGHRRGELASRVAVEYLTEQLRPLLWDAALLRPEQLEHQLSSIVEKANVRVYLNSISDEDNQGMGTTLTVAVLIPGHAVVAHVGDCRAYRLHQETLTQLTVDHTLVQELVDSGSISLDESRLHPRRNVLTRALGVPDLLTPDILLQDLLPGDRLVMCSDGLHGLVAEDTIRCISLQQPSAGLLAEALVQAALELGGEDNITVLTAYV